MKKILLFICFAVTLSGFTHLYAFDEKSVVFTNDFSSDDSWHTQGNGAVNISNGQCNFVNAYCGEYNKVYHSINSTLSDNYWQATTEFSILNPNPYGYGTGVVVLALTAGTLDFESYDASQNYEETYQDGISVVLISDGSVDNDINNWFFMIEGKKGDVRTFDYSSVIHADASISKYYIKLERVSSDLTRLSIFTDPDFLNELPGSPVTYAIDPDISRLNTIQHGTITPGYYSRLINASIDNDVISQMAFNTGISNLFYSGNSEIQVFPNPCISVINIKQMDISIHANASYTVYNTAGTEIASGPLDATRQIDVSKLVEGTFLIRITESKKTYWAKFHKAY
jgi:hypothetical protein